MMGGAVAGGIGLLLFGWAEAVVGYFVREEPLVWEDPTEIFTRKRN